MLNGLEIVSLEIVFVLMNSVDLGSQSKLVCYIYEQGDDFTEKLYRNFE